VFWSGEGITQQLSWYPSRNVFICGPLDIAEPEPELELPEGWVKIWDQAYIPDQTGFDVWNICVHPRRESELIVDIKSITRAHCVRAVNAAVRALEEER
jgi:hypothetical protein